MAKRSKACTHEACEGDMFLPSLVGVPGQDPAGPLISDIMFGRIGGGGVSGSPIPPRLNVAIEKGLQLAKDLYNKNQFFVPGDWANRSACLGMDTDNVFYAPDQGKVCGKYYGRAYRTCARCPVAVQCLADALLTERNQSQHYIFGVRAGLTPRQRLGLAINAGIRGRMSNKELMRAG